MMNMVMIRLLFAFFAPHMGVSSCGRQIFALAYGVSSRARRRAVSNADATEGKGFVMNGCRLGAMPPCVAWCGR